MDRVLHDHSEQFSGSSRYVFVSFINVSDRSVLVYWHSHFITLPFFLFALSSSQSEYYASSVLYLEYILQLHTHFQVTTWKTLVSQSSDVTLVQR